MAARIASELEGFRAGAAALLREGHEGVELTSEELDKIACWIDLLVPYCGDYTEAGAWNEGMQKKHARYLGKGVQKAVANVNGVLRDELTGIDFADQRALDTRMIEIDGSDNKGNLGANALLLA